MLLDWPNSIITGAALIEFIGRPHLAVSRLFDRELDDGLLDPRIDAILGERLSG